MRIPLDYYRILGLPIQATADQLQSSHRDRSVQLPRREYSEVAIVARKQLIDEAYSVLSDPEQRQVYDANFLSKPYEINRDIANGTPGNGFSSLAEKQSPSIEIDEKQLVGALLIFQELGEYELVIKLSQPYLTNGRFKLKLGQLGEPLLVGPDIILTVALACLELGREQWQQGQYENAAASLETGSDLLLQENLFPPIRGEMQADLYKLRPYRILELLEEPVDQVQDRRKALILLQDMLAERGGIDGHGDDQSGLSVDDFLRFIQQLRCYLTVEEQQSLFEAEARRPSAVGTYLAVYALIARGFADRQPPLIRQAKLMLQRLGKRQDVNLEKAICAMLLGQTDEANRSLEQSQEYETLDFIRQNSKQAPDLLPGLCLYGERWLQKEVFPHFLDLANHQVSLKDYFADQQVQAYLETLPLQEETAASEWFPVQSKLMPVPTMLSVKPSEPIEAPAPVALRTLSPTLTSSENVRSISADLSQGRSLSGDSGGKPTSSLALPPTITTRQTSLPSGGENESTPMAIRSQSYAQQRNSRLKETQATSSVERETPRRSSVIHRFQRPSRLVPSVKIDRLLLLGLAGVVGLGLLWLLISLSWGLLVGLFRGNSELLGKNQPMVRIDRPVIEIPSVDVDPLSAAGPVTPEVAQQVIEKWLSVKQDALGPKHEVTRLEEILIPPALNKWQQWAKEGKQNKTYQKYQHNLAVKSVEMNKEDSNRANVVAEVSEGAEIYEADKLVDSRQENLVVRYDLVRSEGQWRIQDWDVVR